MGDSIYANDALRKRVTDAKYEEKWEILKPRIEELYLQEGQSLKEVQELVEHRYGFFAQCVYKPNSHPGRSDTKN